MVKNKGTFQCGTCNLIEEGLTNKEIMELSSYHFAGKHIDKFELRKIKVKVRWNKLIKKRWKILKVLKPLVN